MRPVPAILVASGLAIVVVILWMLHPAVLIPPAPPPANPPPLASDGITASAGFEVAVEPPPEQGGSRQDRILATSVVLYPAHDLGTGDPRGHFIRVGGKAILSRATRESLRPSRRDVLMDIPRIPALLFCAVTDGKPLARGNCSGIYSVEDGPLWRSPSMPSRVPGPLFYWPGSALGKEAALTVGLVRGELYRPPVRQPDAMPAFVCSADLRLPADVVARRVVVPVAEVRETVATGSAGTPSYETALRLPEALADSVIRDVGRLHVGRARDGMEEARAACRDEDRGPGALKVTTRKPGPFDVVEIVMWPPGVRVRFKAVHVPD